MAVDTSAVTVGEARPSPLPVFHHRFVLYLRTWRGSVFSSFLLPVMFLLGMGFSVGSYVDRTGALGVSYVDYIAPGLLASTVLQIAVGETTWPVLGWFSWIRTYHAMRASPLRPAREWPPARRRTPDPREAGFPRASRPGRRPEAAGACRLPPGAGRPRWPRRAPGRRAP